MLLLGAQDTLNPKSWVNESISPGLALLYKFPKLLWLESFCDSLSVSSLFARAFYVSLHGMLDSNSH